MGIWGIKKSFKKDKSCIPVLSEHIAKLFTDFGANVSINIQEKSLIPNITVSGIFNGMMGKYLALKIRISPRRRGTIDLQVNISLSPKNIRMLFLSPNIISNAWREVENSKWYEELLGVVEYILSYERPVAYDYVYKVAARLLERIEDALNDVPFYGDFDEIRIYDEVSEDANTQKGVFITHLEFYMGITPFLIHKDPSRRGLRFGCVCPYYGINRGGYMFMGTVDEIKEKIKNTTSLFASNFYDDSMTLEDRFMDFGGGR